MTMNMIEDVFLATGERLAEHLWCAEKCHRQCYVQEVFFFSPRRFGHENIYIWYLYITHWYILIMTHSILNYVHVTPCLWFIRQCPEICSCWSYLSAPLIIAPGKGHGTGFLVKNEAIFTAPKKSWSENQQTTLKSAHVFHGCVKIVSRLSASRKLWANAHNIKPLEGWLSPSDLRCQADSYPRATRHGKDTYLCNSHHILRAMPCMVEDVQDSFWRIVLDKFLENEFWFCEEYWHSLSFISLNITIDSSEEIPRQLCPLLHDHSWRFSYHDLSMIHLGIHFRSIFVKSRLAAYHHFGSLTSHLFESGVGKCPILGILDITKNSGHLVDH